MKAKILIIGGGVIGTSLALRAAQKTDPLREPVVLLERARVGSGSSGDSGAILRQLYADRLLALMARDSIREYSQFGSRTGRGIGFVRSGVMTLAGPEQPEWATRLREVVGMLSDSAIDIQLLEGNDILEHFPGLAIQPGSVAAWEPDGGFVDPHMTLEAFASLARTYGAVTRLAQEVEEILVEGGRVVGARTRDTEYRAEKVVLAGGPWSGGLLEKLGVDIPMRILQPEVAYFMRDDWDADTTETQVRSTGQLSFDIDSSDERPAGTEILSARGVHPVLIDLEHGSFFRSDPPARRTRVGRSEYSADAVLKRPEDKRPEPLAATCEWARDVLVKRIPDAADNTPDGGTTSWYTLTPDAQPVIGPVPGFEGLLVATGFSGHGFKLAPSVAEGLTQMLFDEPVTAFEEEFFEPLRFTAESAWSGRFGF